MLNWIRNKFGGLVIGGIISLIGFVFVFYGVFTPKATRGLHDGAVAGKVNGENIGLREFNRELARRTDFLKNMSDGKVTDEQLKTFRVKEMVFESLVQRKLMVQEARRLGMVPSDEEVKENIRRIDAFQQDGKFDVMNYRRVLEANNYTPGTFEGSMREDLSVQAWNSYVKGRVHVSAEEVRKQFLLSNEKRNIKYVLLPSHPEKKDNNAAKVGDKARETKMPASGLGDQTDNEKLAEQIIALIGADKAADAKINSLLKPRKIEVKSSGPVTSTSRYLPGVGETRELLKDAFSKQSPLNLRAGGKARKYVIPAGLLIAAVVDVEKPEMEKLDSRHGQIAREIAARKESELYQSWLKALRDKADIERNSDVTHSDS